MLQMLEEIPYNSKICIYGAGETGRFIKDLINDIRKDIKVLYFLDSLKSGNIENIKIIKLGEYEKVIRSRIKSGMTIPDLILICSAFGEQIKDSLTQKNILNFKVLDYVSYCEFRHDLNQKILNDLFSAKNCEQFIQESFEFKAKNFQKGTHSAVASIPKSGTGFLNKLTDNLTNLENTRIAQVFDWHTDMNNVYFPLMVNIYEKDCFCTLWHLQGYDYNIELLKNLNVKTVFLYRNIFDVVVSLRDYFVKTKRVSLYLREIDFLNFEIEEQYDVLIEIILKDELKRFLYWHKAHQKYENNIRIVSYNELVDNTLNTLKMISAFYGLSKNDEEILKAIELTNTKKKVDPEIHFNKGIKGRGKALLTPRQQQRIYDQVKLYKNLEALVE